MSKYEFSYSSVTSSEDHMLDDLEMILAENSVEIAAVRRFMLIVSEAFNNAMIHGNGMDPKK